MSTTRSDICDFMKQVRVIQEPFRAKDLQDITVMKRQTVDLWLRALEEEGLIEIVDASSPKGYGYLYKRVGAFACK